MKKEGRKISVSATSYICLSLMVITSNLHLIKIVGNVFQIVCCIIVVCAGCILLFIGIMEIKYPTMPYTKPDIKPDIKENKDNG